MKTFPDYVTDLEQAMEIMATFKPNIVANVSDPVSVALEVSNYIAGLKSRIADLEMATRWIPVSEQLPEMYIPVLTISGKAKYPRILSRENSIKSWEWASRQLPGYVGYVVSTATHWMPLPEPPKEVE